MAKGPSKVTKIRGVIIPTAWDDQGNVTGIAISSHDENDYQVDHKGKGPELFFTFVKRWKPPVWCEKKKARRSSG